MSRIKYSTRSLSVIVHAVIAVPANAMLKIFFGCQTYGGNSLFAESRRRSLTICRLDRILLVAVMCGLVTLPLFAHDGVHLNGDSVWIDEDLDRFSMQAERLSIWDYSGTDSVELKSSYLKFYSDSGGTTITPSGIDYADGSSQQSAAYSKSETDALLAAEGPAEAWPMICKTTVVDGVVPLFPASPATLFCRSPQSGVPGGDIGSGAGVPEGYFFVVTDVLANCGIGDNCDGVTFWMSRRNIINGDSDIETWSFPLSNTTPAGDKLLSLQFSGPLMILEQGDFLVGMGGLTTSGGHGVYAQVMGFLTANPERLGR